MNSGDGVEEPWSDLVHSLFQHPLSAPCDGQVGKMDPWADPVNGCSCIAIQAKPWPSLLHRSLSIPPLNDVTFGGEKMFDCYVYVCSLLDFDITVYRKCFILRAVTFGMFMAL